MPPPQLWFDPGAGRSRIPANSQQAARRLEPMATSESNRVRRFSLPDLTDLGAEAKIHAFLRGPELPHGRASDAGPRIADTGPFATLATRVDWMEAVSRESARLRRYRRPVSIVIVVASSSASGPAAGWLSRVAGPIAHAVRRGVREADLVTRTATATFQVLLPETTETQAIRFAERVVADCDVWLRAMGAPIAVRAFAAGTTPDSTIEDALARALEASTAG